MVLWGKAGQLFVLHGPSWVTEWQRLDRKDGSYHELKFEFKRVINVDPLSSAILEDAVNYLSNASPLKCHIFSFRYFRNMPENYTFIFSTNT